MRFWKPLIAPASTGTVNVTYIESNYDGDLWVYFTKSAGAVAKGNIYALDEGARGFAINNNLSQRVGTIEIDDTTAARKQASNLTPAPSMAKTYFTGSATGNFTSALYVFTSAPQYELAERMKLILRNYCAVDEPLYRFGLGPDAVENGLIEGMTGFEMPRLGVKMVNYRKIGGGPKLHDMTAVDVIWTAWMQEHDHPEETEAEALEMQGLLYSIAADSQRHWGDIVHDTVIGSQSVSAPARVAGEYDRYSVIIRQNMTCTFYGGQWHDDPDYSGQIDNRYQSVTLT